MKVIKHTNPLSTKDYTRQELLELIVKIIHNFKYSADSIAKYGDFDRWYNEGLNDGLEACIGLIEKFMEGGKYNG